MNKYNNNDIKNLSQQQKASYELLITPMIDSDFHQNEHNFIADDESPFNSQKTPLNYVFKTNSNRKNLTKVNKSDRSLYKKGAEFYSIQTQLHSNILRSDTSVQSEKHDLQITNNEEIRQLTLHKSEIDKKISIDIQFEVKKLSTERSNWSLGDFDNMDFTKRTFHKNPNPYA